MIKDFIQDTVDLSKSCFRWVAWAGTDLCCEMFEIFLLKSRDFLGVEKKTRLLICLI